MHARMHARQSAPPPFSRVFRLLRAPFHSYFMHCNIKHNMLQL